MDITKHGYQHVNFTNPFDYDDPDDAPAGILSPDGREVTYEQAVKEIETGEIARKVADQKIQQKVHDERFKLADDQLAAWEEVFEYARKDCQVGYWFGELVAKIDGKWYRARHIHVVTDWLPSRINIFSAWVNNKRVVIWYAHSWGAMNGALSYDAKTKTTTPFTLTIEN